MSVVPLVGLLAVLGCAAACGQEPGEPLQPADVDEDNYRAAVAGPIDGKALEELGSDVAPFGAPYPIILVHGFSGWTDVGDVGYFYRVVDDLSAAGADVTAPALPPYDSSSDRALVLARVVDSVLARTHKQKVHLIAHSQGGIDARILITDLGYASQVASLTTISSPHRGTAVADLASGVPGSIINPAGRLLAWMLGALEGEPPDEASWLNDDSVAAAYDADLAASINGLRPGVMALFNATHPDPIGVPVFSFAGVSNLRSMDHPACNDGLWAHSDRVDAVDILFAGSGTYLSFSDGGSLLDPTPNDRRLGPLGNLVGLHPSRSSRRNRPGRRRRSRPHLSLGPPRVLFATPGACAAGRSPRALMSNPLAEYDAVVAKVEAAITRSQALAAEQLACRPGCDSCCTAGLSVLPVEAAALQRFVETSGPVVFAAKGEGWCTFLDVDGRCAVYAARPLLCRTHGLPLRSIEKRGELRVVNDGVSVCALNFKTRAPSAAETLDAEAILKLLVVVDRRFREATGLPNDTSRVPLQSLRGSKAGRPA